MEYKLGVMDKYPIATHGTVIEDVPCIIVELDEKVDEALLKSALLDTLESFPHFKTKYVFDKGYKLIDNDAVPEVYNVSDEEKPCLYGKNTNDFPWRLMYWENTVSFEWCHGITDGKGGAAFFLEIISRYFGDRHDIPLCLGPGIDKFYDPKEKGLPEKKQPSGFGRSGIKVNKDTERANLHILRTPTASVLSLAKRSDASPATVVPPLFSRALRKCMTKKKPVKASIVIDVRNILQNYTMQNCILTKEISYIDKFDDMPIELVSTIYRAILDIALQKENVIKGSTEMIKSIGFLVNMKNYTLSRLLMKPVAEYVRSSLCDFTLTYLGKVNFEPKIAAHIKDVRAYSWCDMGYCTICAYDFNGEFFMNIVENYADKTVIPKFMDILREYGAETEETENRIIKRTRIEI